MAVAGLAAKRFIKHKIYVTGQAVSYISFVTVKSINILDCIELRFSLQFYQG